MTTTGDSLELRRRHGRDRGRRWFGAGRQTFSQADAAKRDALPLSADSLVPAELLGDDEIVILAMKPSLWFMLLVSGWWIAIGVPVAVWAWYNWITGPWSTVGQLALAAVIGRLCFALIQWLARFYVLTDRRVLSVSGIFHINVFECSLLKVQHTLMRLSLAERAFGVGSIGFATAGDSGIVAVWRHVADPLEVQAQVQLAIDKARRRHGPGQV